MAISPRLIESEETKFDDGDGPFYVNDAPVVPPVNIMPPEFTGDPVEGETLIADQGAWINMPASFTAQWKRDGVVIPGATGWEYLIDSEDIDHKLKISVYATNDAGASDWVDSAETETIEASE